MISFEPFRKYLDNHNLSLRKASALVFDNEIQLGQCVKDNMSVETLVKICSALNCRIDDVIKWQEEEDVRYYTVNWDKLKEIGGSLYTLSEKTGYAKNTLPGLKKRNSKVKSVMIDKICEYLKCEKEAFCEKDN